MYAERTSGPNDRRSGRVRRGNAVDETYAVLRDGIISGKYRPGVALSQVRLAEELAVSRTPLREAMRRLESENLVISQANRGVVVAPIELGDVEDSYAVRLLVEPALMSAVTDSLTDEDIAAMAEALADMQETTLSPREFQIAHWRYHRVVLERCPAAMRQLIEAHLTRIGRHQRLYFEHPAVVAALAETDALLLDAVRDRDGALARTLLEFHLLDTALGLIMAADTGYAFDTLPLTLHGLGIRLDDPERLRRGEPTQIRWDRDTNVPPIVTTNLYTEHPDIEARAEVWRTATASA